MLRFGLLSLVGVATVVHWVSRGISRAVHRMSSEPERSIPPAPSVCQPRRRP